MAYIYEQDLRCYLEFTYEEDMELMQFTKIRAS